MPQTIDQIMPSLESAYKPQQDIVQSQLDELPKFYSAQKAGLEQAKINSFDDIKTAANASGMLYSGTPINEQNKYVGANYLPALAGVEQSQNSQTTSLKSSLASIIAAKYQSALGIQSQQQAREDEERRFQQQQEAADKQFQQSMAATRAASGGGTAGGTAAPAPAKAGGGAPAAKGYNFNGTSMAGWLQYLNQNARNLNWGQAAAALSKTFGAAIPTNSTLDQALHAYYSGGAASRQNVNKAVGFKA